MAILQSVTHTKLRFCRVSALTGGQPKTFDQIGELIGLTRYKVQVCEMATMCRLRTGVSSGSYLRDLRARSVAAIDAAAMPANYKQTNKTVFNNRTVPAHVSLRQKKEEKNGKNYRKKPGISAVDRRPERAACGRQARTRVRRSLLSHRGHLSEPRRRHGLFLRHHVYPIVQGSFGQVPGGRQHLEIGPKDQTGDHFSLAKRPGSRDEIRCRRQSHHRRRQ